MKIAYEAADAVIESKTFELFKPSDLVIEGDEGAAYRYLFILENEKSNPAGLNKSANKEYIFPEDMIRHWHLLVSILPKVVLIMRYM